MWSQGDHYAPINVKPHLPPNRAEVRIGGDLQMFDDKFPTLGDNYQITNPLLIIPEITLVQKSMDIRVANAPTLGTSSGD